MDWSERQRDKYIDGRKKVRFKRNCLTKTQKTDGDEKYKGLYMWTDIEIVKALGPSSGRRTAPQHIKL